MQNLHPTNTTVLVLTGIIALLIFLLNYIGSKARERKFEIEHLKVDLKFAYEMIEAKENTNAALNDRLNLIDKYDNIKGNETLKLPISTKIAAPLWSVIKQFEKIDKLELNDGNEQLINLIELMANDLTKENYRLRHGKASNEDVLSAGAVVGAYVLRFLTDFKEVKHEKV